MKRKIAKWLNDLARRLDPQKEYELVERYEPVQLGIGYHISKSDVRKYRRLNKDIDSHRKGLEALIQDTKQVIIGNIAAGLIEKGLMDFKISKTVWTADVTGKVVVYKQKNW